MTTKRKRISKKNKSAWRKTDIRDVEDYLEEQRQEERIGSFAEKKDDDLFSVDVTPKKHVLKYRTEKEKRKLNAKKPYTSWLPLENTSKVEDPILKRNTVKRKISGRNIEKEILNPTRPRHFKANADRSKYYRKVEEKLKKRANRIPNNQYDVWDVKDFSHEISGQKDTGGWISHDLSVYTLKNLGQYVAKVHDSMRHKTTKAKKFEVPHSGISYNPSLEDHQVLISKVVAREEKIIKEEKHLKRVTTKMFSKVTAEQKEQSHYEEMLSGLDETKEQNEEMSEKKASDLKEQENDKPYDSINAPVEVKRKSQQARNKELKQKELQQNVLKRKAISKQIVDLNRIKSIKAEVLAEAQQLEVLKKRRRKTTLQKKYEPKRLGRLKYVDVDDDLTMPEDLSGNLRNIKPESSLLVSQFKRYQKRNILPVSVATGKQKAPKVKRFLRNSHKESTNQL